jgi:hypothetical protein
MLLFSFEQALARRIAYCTTNRDLSSAGTLFCRHNCRWCRMRNDELPGIALKPHLMNEAMAMAPMRPGPTLGVLRAPNLVPSRTQANANAQT